MTSRYTIFRVLQRVQSKKTLGEVLGSPALLAFLILAYLTTNTLLLVGNFGVAATLSFTTPPNLDLAATFWRLACVGMATWALTIGLICAYGFHAIAREIERVTNNVREIKSKVGSGEQHQGSPYVRQASSRGGSGGGKAPGSPRAGGEHNTTTATATTTTTANANNSSTEVDNPNNLDAIQNQQRLLVERLDRSSRMMLMTLPLGSAVFIAHASVVPFYWFLVMPHLWNGVFGCLAGWYGNTTPQRRAKVLGRYIFLIPALAKESSEVVPMKASATRSNNTNKNDGGTANHRTTAARNDAVGGGGSSSNNENSASGMLVPAHAFPSEVHSSSGF